MREELRFESLGVEWSRQQKPLGFVDPFAPEVIDFGGGFDAFGKDLQSEVLTELHEGPDERSRFG